jgi:hypothetical protein
VHVPDVVHELVATPRALEKLGARSISSAEVEQLLRNRHVTIRNPGPSIAGCSSGGPMAVAF